MADIHRLKRLAETLRACAQNVIHELKLSPGGDSYEYTGTTGAVDALQEALTAYEEGVEP
jgi:hypothetical protein